MPLQKLKAQELYTNVSVIAPSVQLANPQILKSLETSVRDFLNNRRWTQDNFQPSEKIQCNILINLDAVNGNDFSGSIQVSYSRPVYGSNYTSPGLNFKDDNFAFSYIEFQNMDYQDGLYSTELTAVLAFYANIILGYDYDSFSELGGTPYFQKAMNIVNSAQSSSSKGWSAMDKSPRTRYALANQMMDDRYIPFRKAEYQYYREGLDKMFQDNEKGLNNVLASLKSIQEVQKALPGNLPVKIFFELKWRELINLFSQAPSSKKSQALDMLTRMDVTNSSRYQEALR